MVRYLRLKEGIYMAKMKKLSVSTPPITSFFHIEIPLTIIYGDERTHPWIFNNYIQLYSIRNVELSEDGLPHCFIDFEHSYFGAFRFLELATCPWILLERISLKDVKSKWKDALCFVKEKIDEDKYIGITIIMDKISNYPVSGSHNLFIYGYDDTKEVLYCADHFQEGLFSFEEVSHSEFLNSVHYPFEDELNWGALEGVCLFSKIERTHEKIYDLSIYKIVHDLKMYLYQESIIGKRDDYFIFGINCYDSLIDYYKLLAENAHETDLKAMHTQREHKKLMLLRIEFLMKEYPQLEIFYDPFKELLSELDLMVGWTLKYLFNGKVSFLDKCIDKLAIVKSTEEELIEKLIEALLTL